MIRIKVFKVHSDLSADDGSSLRGKQVAPMEAFIAQIGYNNIRNIIVSAAGSYYCYYAFFYEDNQPYTPYVEDEPKKKGLFG